MTQKHFNGKSIYNPSGKAGEYSYWACNFYVGCSNDCQYCYCKKGMLASTMGGNVPTLKKCFRNEGHAEDVFEKEMLQNRAELQKHGLFFSFTTDPMLPETIGLTTFAVTLCLCAQIPVKILTKRTDFVDAFMEYLQREFMWSNDYKSMIAFGFTLTGHDELEPNASPNAQRIEAIKKLNAAGFKTFASIEPIVDFDSSLNVIESALLYCDLFKVGLMGGKKYKTEEAKAFVTNLQAFSRLSKFYLKDSLRKLVGYNADNYPKIFVERDYNLFKE